jgi:aspartate dehydrogenase
MLGIGLIGCGAMGSTIATAIDDGTIPGAKLLTAFDQRTECVEKLSSILRTKIDVKRSFEAFIKTEGVDLVVEAASQAAVKEYAVRILQKRKGLLIMSVGALLDVDLQSQVWEASHRYHGRVYLISGAIAGIDGIRAAKIAGLDEVVLTTRKNPRSFVGSPYLSDKGVDVEKIDRATLLYEGPAQEAVKYFPANVNVAATLSLAGLGAARTRVRIIADPVINRNIHEVCMKGNFGEMMIKVQNSPHPSNPKSSYLAALSAIETIRCISLPNVRVGT